MADRSRSQDVLAVLNTSGTASFIESDFARLTLNMRPQRTKTFVQYAPSESPIVTLETFSLRVLVPNRMPPLPLIRTDTIEIIVSDAGAVARIPDDNSTTKLILGMQSLSHYDWSYELMSAHEASFSFRRPAWDEDG